MTQADSAANAKDIVRVMICGSVDDGKSTLLGRLFSDAGLIAEDQLHQLVRDSAKSNNVSRDGLDYSLIVDGLEEEREQGITIDVAYRYFETSQHRFIIADAPGHEEYLPNMVTAASTAEVAVLVVDASKGISVQTHRHAYIAKLFGIERLIVVVNKMDLVEYEQAVFDKIIADLSHRWRDLGIVRFDGIPVCARDGDNVAATSQAMRWYRNPTLLNQLNALRPKDHTFGAFRFPVQWVNRANHDFRGYAGTVSAGRIAVGEPVVVVPSGRTSAIDQIVTRDGIRERASAGEAVTLTLRDELSINRGDVIAAASDPPGMADQFSATMIWFADSPMIPERNYLLRFGPRTVNGRITRLRHRLNVETFEELAARSLSRNDIGVGHLDLDTRIAFDRYADLRETGSFVIIDQHTNATLGCGMIQFALRRADNVHWQVTKIDKSVRSKLKRQKPCVIWFTGLSGSGKSTIANLIEAKLAGHGHHTYMLDGDNIRHGLSRDLGFTVEDRVENIRRVAECAKLFVDAGLIVLVALISPFRDERAAARRILGQGEFLECFVSTPLEVCERRDPKGLYRKARDGALPNFTGIDSPYEAPLSPDLKLDAGEHEAEALADSVVGFLCEHGYLF